MSSSSDLTTNKESLQGALSDRLFVSPSFLIIMLSAGLMQWHCIGFWTRHSGSVGILWSLSIEVINIWLWFGRHRFLAIITASILLASSFYELGRPVWVKAQRDQLNAERIEQQIASTQREIEYWQETIEGYLANSRDRIGWAGRIDEGQQALANSRKQYYALLQETHAEPKLIESAAISVIQATSLLILLISQILAIGNVSKHLYSRAKADSFEVISEIRNSERNTERNIETPKDKTTLSKPLSQENEIGNSNRRQTTMNEDQIDNLILAIQDLIRQEMNDQGISQSAWAKKHDVTEKTVSLICNHERRKLEQKETASRNSVITLAQKLRKL